MRIHYMALSLLLLMGCYEDNSQSDGRAPQIRYGIKPTIIFMGDSRADFGGTWDDLPNYVYNVGVGGTTLDYTVCKLYLLDELHPDVVVIFTGANDEREKQIDEFRLELQYIVNYATSRGIRLIIMDITIMPLCLTDPEYANRFAPYQDAMAGTGYYYPIEYDDSDFIDMCHLSENGYKKVSDYIYSLINH